MKKILILLGMTCLILSCNKKESELEITENTTEVVKEKSVVETTEAETKPLILITKDDTLQIYVRADGAPGMYLADDGELKGFYVDLEKAIMEEMGQKYNLNAYSDVGPLIVNIKSGAGHSALSVPNSPDYETFLNLSIVYEILEFVLIVQETNNDIVSGNRDELLKQLSGKKVGVQTRAHIYQVLRDYKEIELVEYPTTTQAVEALNRGEIDAVPEVKRIMEHYSEINNWNLKAIGDPIITQEITTGFSQVLDPSVVDRYNVALKSLIDSGFVDNLYKEYFGE